MKELEEIKLFKRLKKLDKDFASQLKKSANKIKELINKKTTINFPNYTNHDMNHSFKLMDTIFELIEDNKKEFNALEIALMIYSCLYHDLGMAISDKEIEKIKNNNSKYLYGQDFKEIVKNNFDNTDLALQEVIRESHGKIAYDLITTEYEEEFRLPNYESISFAQSLAEICLSHTMDRSYVESLETEITKGEYEYNTQFLSILLRLADILDIDSTRTPLALYEAIDLNDFSKGEWQKNFTIDNIKKIFKSNDLKEIKLEGSCKDIKVHRKLLGYIKWIENELRLAVDLTANMDKKYHISLNTEVKNKIKPIGYSIPDLKLNMDYHAITNLLMGEAIYGSKDLGLRELLQNSIDAIMIKKEMFEMKGMPQKETYEPTINIDIDEENSKVIISDNGMGMNEYIIKNYFLNVGKSYYKSKDFLNYKHNYSPIGNFGIGFLSCFMLSDEVQVITKHFDSNKTYIIDLEKNSEYIAFKEKEDNSLESGTKIILNLEEFKQALNISINDFKDERLKYLIEKNLLIDNNINLKINNYKTKSFFKSVQSDYTIKLDKYFKKIYGNIKINERTYKNKISELIENSKKTFYFNRKETFNEINSIKELKLSEIYTHDKDITYCIIPLLNNKKNKEIRSILKYSTDHDLYEELKNLPYICIFVNQRFDYLSYSDYIDQGEYIILDNSKGFFYKKDDDMFEEIKYSFIKENINELNKYKTPIAFTKNIKLAFIDNEKILYLHNPKITAYNSEYSPCKVFLKNVSLKQEINLLLSKKCLIQDININIIDSQLMPNIKRDKLIDKSAKEFNNAISKVIHIFLLENFNLNEHEKQLVKILINELDNENNPLLKEKYNNYKL